MKRNFYEQVYQVVRCIPRGKVTSYGRIAGMLGRHHAARAVGYALNSLKYSTNKGGYSPDTVPWHRVVNSRGLISRPSREGVVNRQAEKLKVEGVTVSEDLKIDMKEFLWEGLHPFEVEEIIFLP